jgi:hypothetical protein
LERLADVVEKAMGLRVKPASEPLANFDVEDFLDQALEAKTLAALNQLSKPQLTEVIDAANEKLQNMQNEAQAHIAMEAEALCPRPNVSNFRVLQVRDSKASDFGMEGQLTVYGAVNYEGEFEVNNRYWITNVRPKPTSWSKSTAREGEVFLMAGAGSRFIKRPAL